MPVLVITLIVGGYVAAVVLLLAYIVVFIAPRARPAGKNPALDLEYRAKQYLLKQDLEPAREHPSPMDPVCGREAPPDGMFSSVHGGHVYYFCSEDCRNRFARQPHAYLSDTGAQLVHPLRPYAHFR